MKALFSLQHCRFVLHHWTQVFRRVRGRVSHRKGRTFSVPQSRKVGRSIRILSGHDGIRLFKTWIYDKSALFFEQIYEEKWFGNFLLYTLFCEFMCWEKYEIYICTLQSALMIIFDASFVFSLSWMSSYRTDIWWWALKKQLTILMTVKVDLLMWCVHDIYSNMQFWNNVLNCVPLNMKFGIVLHRNKSLKCGRSFIFIIFVSCVRCCKVIWWRLFFTLNGRYSLFC